MRQWLSIAIAAGIITVSANAQGSDSEMKISAQNINSGSIGMHRHVMSQKRVLGDPQMQQMMIEHRKQLRKRIGFQEMMRHPKVIRTMLSNILGKPEIVKKVLNDNPDLKAKLREVL